MGRIVAVSPTFADAVYSCGGTIARHVAGGHEVVAITMFAPDAADDEAAEALGVAAVLRLDLEDAGARGYAETYGGVADGDDTGVVAAALLAMMLSELEPDLVLAPLGLGGHVDHEIVGRALDALSVERLRWVDLPYALTRTPGATLGGGDVIAVPIAEHLEAKLTAVDAYGDDGGQRERLVAYATAEGERAGSHEPVEVLVRRTVADDAAARQ